VKLLEHEIKSVVRVRVIEKTIQSVVDLNKIHFRNGTMGLQQ